MNERDILLDILKGLGIFLVVFAHTYKGHIGELIYLFHMPLFFTLSGCALVYSKRQREVGVKKYLRSLIIPYFVFSFFSFVYWCWVELNFRTPHKSGIFSGLIGSLDFRIQEFINIFTAFSVKGAFEYNIVMWFLPCLFCSLVLYKFLKLKFEKYLPYSIAGIVAVSFYTQEFTPSLPWCFEIAVVTLPFVYIGDSCYLRIKADNSLKWGIIALLTIIIIVVTTHPIVHMRSHVYASWWQFYLVSFSFIYLCIVFCRLILHHEYGILQWLGRNSIIIMCLHEPIKRIVLYIVSVVFRYEMMTIRTSILTSLIIVVLVIGGIYPLVSIINRYAPFMLGKS